MPLVSVMVHPLGLHPVEAIRAWHKHTQEGMSLTDIIAEGDIRSISGDVPGRYALWSSIRKVKGMGDADLLPRSNYSNCGRSRALTKQEERAVVEFVKKWRHKRFCTSQYIKREMRLQASTRTLCRVLNEHGYYWKPVPKVQGISKEHLAARAEFVNKYANRTPAWWQEHMHMVLDGVTLTMPPKTLSGREKHAAQRLTSMWMCSGERLQSNEPGSKFFGRREPVHTFKKSCATQRFR